MTNESSGRGFNTSTGGHGGAYSAVFVDGANELPDEGARRVPRFDEAQRPSPPANLDELQTMADAVARAGIEQVPEAARIVGEKLTQATDEIASDMRRTGELLMTAADALEGENRAVCASIQGLLMKARTLKELTRATRAAYADIPNRRS